MAAILPGRGTLLQHLVTATYTTIANRVKIAGPKSAVKPRDVTHLDSAMVATRPAIGDPGNLSLTLFFDPNDTLMATLRASVLTPSQTLHGFKLVYADGLTTPANDIFSGFIASFELNGMEVEGSLGADVEITISDLFTSTAGTV